MATPDDIYRRLYLIRRVEEEIARVYPSDKIQSPIHLSIGQELASVAVCADLRREDKVLGTYRGHALYLAKGGDLRAFVAELYGKITGCARGKGGSMHLVAPDVGLLGCSAIVGQLIPVAVGVAWAQKIRKTDAVTAVFFGDGACEEGVFAESLNLAALHRLPILFVCENNGYAIVTPRERRQSSKILSRVRAFVTDSEQAHSDYTTEWVACLAGSMVQRCRDGYGPAFLEILSTREREHVGPNEDWDQGYRARDPQPCPDPVAVAERAIDVAEARRIRDDVEAEIADAFAFAESSPVPGSEELMEHLYAP